MKRCKTCQQDKPEWLFVLIPGGGGERGTVCTDCVREYMKRVFGGYK